MELSNEEQKQYIEALEEVFALEGWKKLSKDLQEAVDSMMEQISNGVATEQYHHTTGRISAFRQVINFPKMLEHYKAEADKENVGIEELP